MPVRELVRGLAGALVALLATVILTLCLAETIQRRGYSEWGVWWERPGKTRTTEFAPVWQPVLVCGAMNMVFGYVLAGQLTSKRGAGYALAGAVLVVVLIELCGGLMPAEWGQGGRNSNRYCELFLALGGACAGAAIEEARPRTEHRTKRAESGAHRTR